MGQLNGGAEVSQKRITGKKAKKLRAKIVARSPNWLRTIQITKRGSGPLIRGTFGAASEVRRIDPSEYKGDVDK